MRVCLHLLVILTALALLCSMAKGQGPTAEGVYWSENWSALHMPDSTVACRWDGVNLRCIPIPPGSILLIPKGD